MKKILIAATMFMAFALTGAHAQTTAPATTTEQQPASTDSKTTLKYNRQEIIDQLNLTADQKKQLVPLEKEEKAKRDKINNDTSLTPEEKKAQLKSLKKEGISKMSKILTPEQLTKLKELKAKNKDAKDQR